MGDFSPYAYKSSDYGQTWELITSGVPKSVHSFAHVIREDPKRPGMLYLGVDNGLYISTDDGAHWMPLRNNLPPAPVYWLEVQERFDDLVVGTYGRGYYILDNLAPLREFDTDAKGKEAHLFSMRPAYRFQEKQSIKTDGPSFNSGRNPAYGAEINYYLKDSTDLPVEIRILNGAGEVVRSIEGFKAKGVNRVMWDLRYAPTYKPKLQTTPPGRPWVELNGEGWRPLVTWDLDLMRGQFGPRVVPDSYTVKLIIGETEYSQELVVLKDPSSDGTLTEIKQQVAFSLELRDAMNQAVTLINELESIRAELVAMESKLTRSSDRRRATALLQLAEGISGILYDIHLTGAREDAFRSPMKLYGRLSALASDITGNGVDFKPTYAQEEVFSLFDDRLKEAQARFTRFLEVDLQKFKTNLKSSEIKLIPDGIPEP
jgi:hypothetical protein